MEDTVYTDDQLCAKCVNENEIVYDQQEDFVTKILSADIECPEQLNREILKNLTKCTDSLLMFIKERMILNELRVRYHPNNDIPGLQEKIVKTNLSLEVRQFLQEMSETGYTMMKGAGMLDTLVELDSERPAKVVVYGKTLKMTGYADILCDGIVEHFREHGDISTASSNSMSSASSNTQECHKEIEQSHNKVDRKDVTGSDSIDRAVVTVCVTARNHLNASTIYKQLILSYLHTLSRFYFLVLHVGPLVEKQQVVLYEYIPSEALIELIKTYDGKILPQSSDNEKSEYEFVVSLTVKQSNSLNPPTHVGPKPARNVLDLCEMERCFRESLGSRLQKVADLREYFKYLAFDYNGVKDHKLDKKNRYKRHMVKQEQKKQLKSHTKQGKESKSFNPPEANTIIS